MKNRIRNFNMRQDSLITSADILNKMSASPSPMKKTNNLKSFGGK